MPLELERSHRSQPPEQLTSQQTPSVQMPDSHSLWAVQELPFVFLLWQLPATQRKPGAQFASPVQLVGQLALEPLHT